MSNDLREQLGLLESEGAAAVESAGDREELERLRLELLGRKGRLTGILRGLGQLPPEDRPLLGAEANRIKDRITVRIDERSRSLPGARTRARGTT